MKATLFISLGFGLLAACGSSGGSKNPDAPGGIKDGPGSTIDAPGMVDAPGMTADAPPAPAMITISGTATARGIGSSTPVQGATIAAYKTSNEMTPVATTTTDAQGNFSLTISTGGIALDGYLKATANTYLDTYLYPPAPLTADFAGAAVNLVTQSTLDLGANTICRSNLTSADGAIAAEVVDTAGNFVQGATVSSNPAAGTYCYNSNGLPSNTATSTDTDGIGYMFKITGTATVTAAKSGLTFKSHVLKARAGALTTTIITE